MCVKGIESVLGLRGHDVGFEVSGLACADGCVCGERPVVSEGIEGKDRGRESGRR